MANKFKCKDCRHSFSLNAGSESICPKCKSDNIEPQRSSNVVLKLLLFVVMAAVGFFVTDILIVKPKSADIAKNIVAENKDKQNNDFSENKTTASLPYSDSESTTEEIYEEEPIEEPEPLVPFEASFSVLDKNLTESGFTFKVVVNADYDSAIKQFELYTVENDTVLVLTSTDGKFNGDKYYAATGQYYIKAIYEDGNYAYSSGIDGIVKPLKEEPKTVTKIGIDELQSKIDNSFNNRSDRRWYAKASRGGDKRLDDDVIVNNITNGKTYPSIANMFQRCWIIAKKINVESVTYDEATGKLNSITISHINK